jgi:hypothetical protein
MPQYLLSYRIVNGYTPSEETAAAWRAWFDTMGDQLVELGKPAVDRASVGYCATETTQLGGYSVINADDLEAALAIAKGCPQIDVGGGVEVGLLAEVPAPSRRPG